MTALDLEVPGIVTDAIAEFGKLITIGTVAAGTYDPNTSSSAPAGTPRAVKALVEAYRGQGLAAGLVESGDLKLTVAGQSLPEGVTTEDVATVDGVGYTIVNVMPTFSGELIALYELQVRR